eukprot:4879925-Alexandrium_andersonii.AAC.1
MYASKKHCSGMLQNRGSTASTATTFRATLDYVAKADPVMVFLENVDDLSNEAAGASGSNLDTCQEEFVDLGYE